jgi:hypothetical protein
MHRYTQDELDRDVPELDQLARERSQERLREEFSGISLEELMAEFPEEDDWD